ncbi:CBS domain-containing protein [Streptomyces roseirectus]|uniref:CBS domain-containing protein n=1 Tax=Streptomyces roseirectus TaxID=2768066 RepID=A0A7H0I678_9ACTN|nr:CBS domain-containing protein [Streptomyces roseirectus]QNP68294.1 CBS domain-containing protein [Streptomyces roseirectus]
MNDGKVGSVMTADVVHALPGTPFKEVARLLADHRISGLPVLDDDDKVLGVVSETDLMARQAAPGPERPARRTRAKRRQATKVAARTAGQLMSGPAVTVHADDTIAEAARTMAERHVARLPVVDVEERLVGIVTRGDLLRVFLLPDAQLRAQVIEQVLTRGLWLPAGCVEVFVTEGVVTLSGHLDNPGDREIAVSMTRRLDGVVDVVDRLHVRRGGAS